MELKSRVRIFTWHIHGSYLFYLSQGDYDIYIPIDESGSEGYCGRGNTFPFGPNVYEIQSDQVEKMNFDLILFQTDKNYLIDQFVTLSEVQRRLPKIYLEHDPPWGHPTNEIHPVKDPQIFLVHVTHFNKLMWDNHLLRTRVIRHGVIVPEIHNPVKNNRGIVVINNLEERGRLLGSDIFNEVRRHVPIDLIGMGTETYGIGEVLHPSLPHFISGYSFFFNPIRYTSLGLAVCEAMMLGLPIVGLATTEMSVTIENGQSGHIHTDVNILIERMQSLIENPDEAARLGKNARSYALEHFNIKRFIQEWEILFHECIRNGV